MPSDLIFVAVFLWFAFKPAPTLDIRPANNPIDATAEYNFEVRTAAGDVFTTGPFNQAALLSYRLQAAAKGWSILKEIRVR